MNYDERNSNITVSPVAEAVINSTFTTTPTDKHVQFSTLPTKPVDEHIDGIGDSLNKDSHISSLTAHAIETNATTDPMMVNGFWVLRTEINDGTKTEITEYQIVPDTQSHDPRVCLATQFKLSTKDTAFMSHKEFMKAVDTCDRKK